MNKEKKQELNLKISTLRGYRKPPRHHCGLTGWNPMSDAACPACEEPTRFDAAAFREKYKLDECRDWVDDPHANAALIDEMLQADCQIVFARDQITVWSPKDELSEGSRHIILNLKTTERQITTALAYLAWKK